MTELRFDDRVVVITGAGRGLGREHALALSARGASVVVNDLGSDLDGTGSSDEPAAQVVKEIESAGGRAVANTDTVTTPEGAHAITATALDAFGRLDIVINNAGINLAGAFEEMPSDQFDRVMDVQFNGTMHVARAAWPHLKAAGYGRVVNTTSAAFQGWPILSAYSCAKAAIYGLTRTLAAEGEAHGIKVNALAPVGYTRMTTSAGLPEEAAEALGKIIQPHYPSIVAAYLAHESCAINGEVLSACGPRVARLFVAETKGHTDVDLTVEAVAENIDAIMGESGYQVFPHGEANLDVAIAAAGAALAGG